MKRPRSSDDLESYIDKESSAPRSSRSSFHAKPENPRKCGSGFSSFPLSSNRYDRDRSTDEEGRDASRKGRKRLELEFEGFERRKVVGLGFDRYGGREGNTSSGGSLHRSSAREFPKGFRSERDRSRRESGGMMSWRRFGSGEDGGRGHIRECAPEERNSARTLKREMKSPSHSRDSGSFETGKKGDHFKGQESKSKPSNSKSKPSPNWSKDSEPERSKIAEPGKTAVEIDSKTPETEDKSEDADVNASNKGNHSGEIEEGELAQDKTPDHTSDHSENRDEAENLANGEREEKIEKSVAEEPQKVEAIEEDEPKGKEEGIDLEARVEARDKGKKIARSPTACDADMEGPSKRGFELFSSSPVRRSADEQIEKEKEDNKLTLEPFDLSLSLPNVLLPIGSPGQARSIHSRSTFRTNSQSMSFSGSQSLFHNPSCSLTHNTLDLDNLEQSVHSRPIFQGIDQVRLISNGHVSKHLEETKSPAQSVGSHEMGSNYSFEKKQIMRDKHRILHKKTREAEFVDNIIGKIVFDPVHVISKLFDEMPPQSVILLKESISEAINQGQISVFQSAIQSRSDLTLENILKSHRLHLEILLSLKTGMKEYLTLESSFSSSKLAEVFLNLRCRNLSCNSHLPVDECDCKVCSKNTGFCSACMCLVCSKFDNASNTCCWIGCDVCLHWCHADCALRESFIRNGRGASGTSEMQFHCVACDHPSEMFGFVKEVFHNFAKEWPPERFRKELEYVRRIFAASKDERGRKLYEIADTAIPKLTNKAKLLEIYSYTMSFLNLERKQEKVGTSKEEKVGSWGVFGELEGIVRIKMAEAEMFEGRAEDARREAEGLKRIAVAKREKIEEEFSKRVGKLRMGEAEELRKRRYEEYEALERAHREFLTMKIRMEADIHDLLLKMEATKRNLVL